MESLSEGNPLIIGGNDKPATELGGGNNSAVPAGKVHTDEGVLIIFSGVE